MDLKSGGLCWGPAARWLSQRCSLKPPLPFAFLILWCSHASLLLKITLTLAFGRMWVVQATIEAFPGDHSQKSMQLRYGTSPLIRTTQWRCCMMASTLLNLPVLQHCCKLITNFINIPKKLHMLIV